MLEFRLERKCHCTEAGKERIPLYQPHPPDLLPSLPRPTLTSPGSSSGLPPTRLLPGSLHRSARRLLTGASGLPGAPAPRHSRRRARVCRAPARLGTGRYCPATAESFAFQFPVRPAPPPPTALLRYRPPAAPARPQPSAVPAHKRPRRPPAPLPRYRPAPGGQQPLIRFPPVPARSRPRLAVTPDPPSPVTAPAGSNPHPRPGTGPLPAGKNPRSAFPRYRPTPGPSGQQPPPSFPCYRPSPGPGGQQPPPLAPVPSLAGSPSSPFPAPDGQHTPPSPSTGRPRRTAPPTLLLSPSPVVPAQRRCFRFPFRPRAGPAVAPAPGAGLGRPGARAAAGSGRSVREGGHAAGPGPGGHHRGGGRGSRGPRVRGLRG